MVDFHGFRWAFLTPVFLGGIAMAACLPQGSSGQCDFDEDCLGRGTFCDTITHECEVEGGEHPFTEESPPADFDGKIVPFFRGKVCTAKNFDAQASEPVPLTFNPCWHPCMMHGTRHRYTTWQCSGSSCAATALFWTEGASGVDCPDNVFGKFDVNDCVYDQVANGAIGPFTVEDSPIEAIVEMEIPFITNADMEDIAAASDGNKREVVDEKVKQYKKEADRTFILSVLDGNPSPPEMCGDEDTGDLDVGLCTCVDIGFDAD